MQGNLTSEIFVYVMIRREKMSECKIYYNEQGGICFGPTNLLIILFQVNIPYYHCVH